MNVLADTGLIHNGSEGQIAEGQFLKDLTLQTLTSLTPSHLLTSEWITARKLSLCLSLSIPPPSLLHLPCVFPLSRRRIPVSLSLSQVTVRCRSAVQSPKLTVCVQPPLAVTQEQFALDSMGKRQRTSPRRLTRFAAASLVPRACVCALYAPRPCHDPVQ